MSTATRKDNEKRIQNQLFKILELRTGKQSYTQ